MYEQYMRVALAQARKGVGRVSPNPLVGAVVDLAFSQSIYDALVRVQEEMGGPDAFEIVYSEGIFEVDDAAAAIRDCASHGF